MFNNAQLAMAGGRLAYVIIPVPPKSKLKRVKISMKPKVVGKYPDGKDKIGHDMVKEVVEVKNPGFMVYFPMGHVLHMSERALRRHRLNRPAKMVNVRDLLAGDNVVANLMMAQDDAGRADGFASLERNTVDLATRKTGHRLLLKDEPMPDEFGEAPPKTYADPRDMFYRDGTEAATVEAV